MGTMLRTARRARYRVSRKEFPLWEGIAAFITVINCGMIFFSSLSSRYTRGVSMRRRPCNYRESGQVYSRYFADLLRVYIYTQ